MCWDGWSALECSPFRGIGPFIAAGPIVAALAGAGALGTVAGIVGALVGLGMPEYEARRYEGRVKHGGILLSVHCDAHEWVKRAEGIMKLTGAEDISSAGEAHADFAISDKPMLRTRSPITEEPVTPENPNGPAAHDTRVPMTSAAKAAPEAPGGPGSMHDKMKPDGHRQAEG